MSEKKLFFECLCGHSVLKVSRDEWDQHTNFISLVIYGEYTAGLKDRLRHIWSILKYGHPWGSTELLLSEPEAARLATCIVRLTEEE